MSNSGISINQLISAPININLYQLNLSGSNQLTNSMSTFIPRLLFFSQKLVLKAFLQGNTHVELVQWIWNQNIGLNGLGPKKYQKIARMYDRTGLSTKCTLIKTGFKNLRTGTEAKFRPFVDSLHVINQALQLSTTAAMILSLEGFF